jgi:D-alanyl-D-alanine dipeptidase
MLLLLSALLAISHPNADATRSKSRVDNVRPAANRQPAPSRKSAECLRLEAQGLVNVKDYAPDMAVQLAYASTKNLLHTKLYHDFNQAYLQRDAAQKLARAQQYIRHYNPRLSLLVRDAVRPQRVQLQCWKLAQERGLSYLFTPPSRISMHTYGVAVDVSLVDLPTRTELDFGCAVDDPGALAAPKRELEMLRRGLLRRDQYANRVLLRQAMKHAGFHSIGNEWWHFEACTREEAERRYKAVW